jgi:hypothetical protein
LGGVLRILASAYELPNEIVFKERLSEFEKKYLPDHLNEVGYIRTTWLDPYKEKLVKAWVD